MAGTTFKGATETAKVIAGDLQAGQVGGGRRTGVGVLGVSVQPGQGLGFGLRVQGCRPAMWGGWMRWMDGERVGFRVELRAGQMGWGAGGGDEKGCNVQGSVGRPARWGEEGKEEGRGRVDSFRTLFN